MKKNLSIIITLYKTPSKMLNNLVQYKDFKLFIFDHDIQNNKRNKGKISFEYKDLDQLNKIIDVIKTYY